MNIVRLKCYSCEHEIILISRNEKNYYSCFGKGDYVIHNNYVGDFYWVCHHGDEHDYEYCEDCEKVSGAAGSIKIVDFKEMRPLKLVGLDGIE